MQIVSKPDGTKLTLFIEGRLDTQEVSRFDAAAKSISPETVDIVLDFSRLEYIASIGLRTVLGLNRLAKERDGRLVIVGANESVKNVFRMTGLAPLIEFL